MTTKCRAAQQADAGTKPLYCNRYSHAFFHGKPHRGTGDRQILQAHTGAVKQGDLRVRLPPRRQPGITRAPDLRQSRPAPAQAPVSRPEPVVTRPASPVQYQAPQPQPQPQQPPVERPSYTPRPAQPSADDDLDVPDFLK